MGVLVDQNYCILCPLMGNIVYKKFCYTGHSNKCSESFCLITVILLNPKTLNVATILHAVPNITINSESFYCMKKVGYNIEKRAVKVLYFQVEVERVRSPNMTY